MFEGEGFVDDPVNVAIDDVSVTTENCVLLPYYAKPGDLFFLLPLFIPILSNKELNGHFNLPKSLPVTFKAYTWFANSSWPLAGWS